VFNLPDRHVTTLLLTFGLGLVIEEGLKVCLRLEHSAASTPISGAIEVMGVLLPKYRLFLIVIGFAIVAAVAIVINKTRLGALVRAAAFDRNMAASLGVPVSRVFALTFALGVALAGLAGVLLAPIYRYSQLWAAILSSSHSPL
jgi:branched-chain amino acid transport system permease protein